MLEAAVTVVLGEAAGDAYRALKEVLAYIFRKINHANDLDNSYRRLVEEGERLFARRDDVEAEVNGDKTKSISKEFAAWIKRVRAAEREFKELKYEYIKGSKRPFRKRDVWSRSDLNRRLGKKCEELCGLWAEGRVKTEPIIERPRVPENFMRQKQKTSLRSTGLLKRYMVTLGIAM